MRAKQYLLEHLSRIVADMDLALPEKLSIEFPKDKSHGDLATNLCMLLAKQAKTRPQALAARIAEKLVAKDPLIAKAETAGPGFLNITFSPLFWQKTLLDIAAQDGAFGSSNVGMGRKVQVEYVSANPTGPLHIGHGRGAAVGDSLARVLRFAGYDVSTEYYINDAGLQMRILGASVWARVQQLSGRDTLFPETYYQGEYITDIARELLKKNPSLADMPEEKGTDICFEYAMNEILEGIKKDLLDFRVHHDVWFSENSLVQAGAVDKGIEKLKGSGLVYEEDGAIWLNTAELGDDKNRVLKKSNGYFTYFASDIAYHHNKYERGFDLAVDIWGADHHGYVPRMRAAMKALGYPPEAFDVILIQLVNLLRDGVQVAMSTRSGQFVTLADVVNEVGADAARFMFLSRKSDSPLDFDLEVMKRQSMDNPVYYVQYAHARVCSVLRKAAEKGIVLPENASPEMAAPLTDSDEIAILKLLDGFTDIVAGAARTLSPHHVSYYLQDLAGALHSYYSSHPVLNATDRNLISARLMLMRSIGVVIKNGLDLLGVSAPESM